MPEILKKIQNPNFRLTNKTFNFPSVIRDHFYTANYFVKSAKIIRDHLPETVITMQFFQRNDNVMVAGVDEAIALLQTFANNPHDLDVEAVRDGDVVNAKEPVLKITGRYKDFGFLESLIDGIFLQILEDGRLTDSKGETVYFSDTIIIFTSNLGASQVMESSNHDEVAKQFIDIVKEYFDNEIRRPEILGRIGYNNIVPFNFITDREFLNKIAASKLKPIKNGIFEKHRLHLDFADEVKFVHYLTSKADTSKGAREVLNAINDHLLNPLAMFMFKEKQNLPMFRGGRIVVKLDKGNISFELDHE